MPQRFRIMMCISHGHGYRLVTQLFLNCIEVYSGLYQPCSEGMPQIVKPDIFKAGLFSCLKKGP